MGTTRVLTASFLVFVVSPLFSQAQNIVYVDSNAPGANNGTSWHDAYHELADALQAAAEETTIRSADGIYSPGPMREDTFHLKNKVILEGGYAGYGAPDPDARDIALYKTTLDGGGYNYHVVTASAVDSTAILDGFTIAGGNADGQAIPKMHGGGLYIDSGDPIITRCMILNNSAVGFGGGVYIKSSHPTLEDCTLSENQATLQGGGIYCGNGSTLSLSACSFIKNTSKSGGGIYNFTSDPTLSGCEFIENTAEKGGGMHNNVCSSTLSHCTFSKNSALGGGGIYNFYDCVSQLDHCTFVENSAVKGSGGGDGNGGGIFNKDQSTCLLDHCTFPKNTADKSGGGVQLGSGDTAVTNCMFDGNSAHIGGGLFNDSDGQMTDCTFRGNHADFGGGGMFASHDPQLVNCRFEFNSADSKGGGISIYGDPVLVNCLFLNNMGGDGGGMEMYGEYAPLMQHCTFFRNTSDQRGGAVYTWSNCTPTFNHCLIAKNSAYLGGGGIFNSHDSQATLVNTVISENTSSKAGGGVYNAIASGVLMTNCTLIGNSADTYGDGVFNEEATLQISNSILWNNESVQIYSPGETDPLVTYSCIQGGYRGEGNIDADPLFAAMDLGDFHILYHSPCRNAGDNSAILNPEDFEGDPRLFDGAVDMGADEFYAHLYVLKEAFPGDWVDVNIIGIPGEDALLFRGSALLDPPVPTAFGEWFLAPPVAFLGMGLIPSNGLLSFPFRIPSEYHGSNLFLQALLWNDRLTNPFVLNLKQLVPDHQRAESKGDASR